MGPFTGEKNTGIGTELWENQFRFGSGEISFFETKWRW